MVCQKNALDCIWRYGLKHFAYKTCIMDPGPTPPSKSNYQQINKSMGLPNRPTIPHTSSITPTISLWLFTYLLISNQKLMSKTAVHMKLPESYKDILHQQSSYFRNTHYSCESVPEGGKGSTGQGDEGGAQAHRHRHKHQGGTAQRTLQHIVPQAVQMPCEALTQETCSCGRKLLCWSQWSK